MRKKCHDCYLSFSVLFVNGFICSGISNKHTIHPMDKLHLCIKSDICNRHQEMTVKEAAIICSLLTKNMAELSPSIKRRIK